ncbi:MAG: TlpA family protein disulfide reductase [Gammaproteobacteria bacterium]|nr:TlpA family protein disulfide reductase [Gammaproteobacteria bacterium]NIR97187.1 TlpA family protein disulfide reductase [Gammaproteobacteria bacterium]NIT62904.1 TlpA family protein disulfide reductase [Gammaproteobacteria bacterium]NIV19869.1 redoxin domain-containing protein [Gammaproteobacteria bacterium]NIY31484.1 redoxin domain-containing protein [Gammaproteobacteria bacterium]
MIARRCKAASGRAGRVALALAALVPAAGPGGEGGGELQVERPKVSLPAPGFELPDLQGDGHSLARYRGRAILLHFWATFCVPCRKELPELERAWRRHRASGLTVLGVAVDRGDARLVQRFARDHGVTFPVLLDPRGTVRNRYEVRGLPTTYLIGPDGRIKGRAIGARHWDGPAAGELIGQLLQGS